MKTTLSVVLASVIVIGFAPGAAAHAKSQGHRPGAAARGPLVVSEESPFFAEGSQTSRESRAFTATILASPARVPAAWPLVIDASIVVGGDPLRGFMGDVRCAVAIDGSRGALTPVPRPDGSVSGAGPIERSPNPAFPDLRWFGSFTAGPIPPGRHAFTLECESATDFELRGSASLKVYGNPGRANGR